MMAADEWSVVALLCDSAQVADGKLFILGGGWSLTGPGPFVHSLALKLDVPWNQANARHTLSAVLATEDGVPVRVGDDPGEVRLDTQFEVGRPPGVKPGTPLEFPLAVNFGPMELPAGSRYAWLFEVDGSEVGRVAFQTRETGVAASH
jgi:hypothetical protein